MRRTTGMRQPSLIGLILILFFAMAIVACGDSTGSGTSEEFNSGDAGVSGDAGGTGGSGRWVPQVGDAWQWQLQGSVNTRYDVDVYDVDQAAALVGDFDFTVNEECHAYNECNALNVFIDAGKPVFNAEYDSLYVKNIPARQGLCADALADGFSTLVLPLNLDDSFRYSCGTPGAGAEGALLGLYYGDESITATSQKLQRTVPLHLTYYDFDHDWTGSVTRGDIQAGRIPFVNWEVFSATLDDIISGVYDDMLAVRAGDAKALGARIFVDFGAEMNGDWSPWGGAQNGNSADKYIAAYRHVHDALAEADNITWLWCPNVTDEPRTAWNAAMNYYPGDDYVDWTCADGYNWGNAGGAGWQSFEEVFADIYPQLAAKNKPIMIGEMASAESGGNKAEFINGIVPALKSKFPLIRGLVWFDINKETDWRISSSPESEAAFIQLAADRYFNPN